MSTPQIPWLRVLVEGAVIVGSILLALTADAWWDGVTERALERDALDRLSAEFSEVDSVLANWQANHQSVVDAAEVLLRHAGPDPVPLAPDSIGVLLWTTLVAWTFDPPATTLPSLQSSGRLDLIRSQELHSELARWQSLLDDLRGDEENLLSYTYRTIQPWIVSHVAQRSLSYYSGDSLYAGTQSRFPDGLVAVLADRDFEGHVDMRRTETNNILANYSALRAQVARLKAIIDAQLRSR